MALFRNVGVNLRDRLCDVPRYASAQSLDFLALAEKLLIFEPIKRAHSPLLDFDELSRVAAGLASVYKISIVPYGRRLPAACCRQSSIGN